MDRHLASLAKAITPPINAITGYGYAHQQAQHVTSYLDDILKTAARSFIPGLSYLSWERCTPEEEYSQLTKIRQGRRTMNISRSDLYMIKLMFSYGERKFPIYLQLPDIRVGNIIYINGAAYIFKPVLADKVISIGGADVFVKLLKGKLTFRREPHTVVCDDKLVKGFVCHSMLYHQKATKKSSSKHQVRTTMAHYLFCRRGLKDALITYGKVSQVRFGLLTELNDIRHDDDWIVYRSAHIRPKAVARKDWEEPDWWIAIPRKDKNDRVHRLILAAFYVIDHHPKNLLLKHADHEQPWTWVFGKILFGSRFSNELRLIADARLHFSSLTDYIDGIIHARFKQLGYMVNDIYDLFVLMIENIDDWIVQGGGSVNSMYGRELSVLYYLLEQLSNACFRINYAFKNERFDDDETGNHRTLPEKFVYETLRDTLRTGLIYSLKDEHVCMSTDGYGGDNMAIKMAPMIVPQTSANKDRRSRTSNNDRSKTLHASLVEVACYRTPAKSEASGHNQLNPFIQTAADGTIIRHERYKELLDKLQRKISRD